MRKVIKDFNPDLTISTHFFGSSLIDYYNRKGVIKTKLITVVTDYEAHALWLRGYKREQAIVVADKDEVSYLVKKGIDRNKIKAIGIPINPVTSTNFDVEKATKKYGFTGERPICLFFGGGGNGGVLSLPYIKQIIKSNSSFTHKNSINFISTQSSLSTKHIYSPNATLIPSLRAEEIPPFSL